MAFAHSRPDRWFPPRTDIRPVGRRWGDWWRWARHRLGYLQRDLDRQLERVLMERERLQDAPDSALQEAIEGARVYLRHAVRHERRGQDDHVAEALAAAAVAAERTVGMAPYPVQLFASLGMWHNSAVQMAPGEGKTLSVALSAVLQGWTGRICHVITANDYLAQRDVELMQPLFHYCGLQVAAAHGELQPDGLREVYRCDIVYATGKQLLADFLRDQLLLGGASDGLRRKLWKLRGEAGRVPVMRGLYAAIIDEADSVLIDEANTPLIISAPQPNPMLEEAVMKAREIVDQLEPDRDYLLDETYREVQFSDEGEDRLEQLVQVLPRVWHVEERRNDLLTQAILARDFFTRDRHYIIDDGKVVIVDENTGRAMPGRSWSYGLHQAIEAREQVEITPPARTMARMSFQHFFQRYHRLAGASGTLQGIRHELWKTYDLLTLEIPTRVPSRLEVPPASCFATRDEKVTALLDTVIRLHEAGHPVLVGTRRISDSELLQDALQACGLECEVLNAKQLEREALIIAAAGEAGRITVATNMAGRGTDIQVSKAVAERGGLQVLMLEPHESARVDWQLFGRAGRHGLPGRAEAFASLEDDLLRRHLALPTRVLATLAARGWLLPQAMRSMLRLAQWRAQRRAWWQRRQLQQREKLMKKQLSFTGNDDLAAEALARQLAGSSAPAGAARGRTAQGAAADGGRAQA